MVGRRTEDMLSMKRVALRRHGQNLGVGLLMAGIGLIADDRASAQTLLLTAHLALGNPNSTPGTIVQPFLGDTGTSGWAVITVDTSLRTFSYHVTVVNPPSNLTGHLHLATTAMAGPVILTFPPPVPAFIVL